MMNYGTKSCLKGSTVATQEEHKQVIEIKKKITFLFGSTSMMLGLARRD